MEGVEGVDFVWFHDEEGGAEGVGEGGGGGEGPGAGAGGGNGYAGPGIDDVGALMDESGGADSPVMQRGAGASVRAGIDEPRLAIEGSTTG